MVVILSPKDAFACINKNDLSTKHVTENFMWKEFLVNQTEKPALDVLINIQKVALILEQYRKTYFKNNQVTITSGWRSDKYNSAIPGSAKKSLHIKGLAVDFVVKDFSPQEVQEMLDPIHFGGMEFAPTWTHIDLRGYGDRFKP